MGFSTKFEQIELQDYEDGATASRIFLKKDLV